jgi:hypothetical protein
MKKVDTKHVEDETSECEGKKIVKCSFGQR